MSSKKRTRRAKRASAIATQTEMTLAESERFARASLDALTAHIAVLDGNGRILAANRAWRALVKQNELPWQEIGGGENYLGMCDRAAKAGDAHAATSASLIRKVIDGQIRETSFEYPCHSPHERRWFHCRITRFSRGGPVRVVVAHENITELKEASEALARSHAELERRVVERTEALRRAHEFSESLIDTVEIIVLLLSPEGRIIRFNRHLEKLSGWTLDEARGRDWFNLFLPRRDRARIREVFQRAIRGGKTQGNVNPIITKDGRELEIEWHNSMLKDSGGRLVGLLCSGRDITERLHSEMALRESERRERERSAELAAILDSVPAPIFIAHDPACLHITGNRAADELLRVHRGAEASLSASEQTKPHHFKVFSAGRELRTDELPAQRAARGFVVDGFEETIVFNDGTIRDMVAYATPLLDDGKQPRGAVLVMMDITERKRVEAALRESEERLSYALNATTDGVWDWNIKTGEVIFSPQWLRLLGYSPKEVSPSVEFWKSIIHPDDTPRVWTALREHFEGRTEIYQCENRLRMKSGNYRWNLDRGKVVEWDQDGSPLRMVGTDSNITERKRLEAEVLRIAEDERLRVAADLHDGIRQELVGIQFFAHMLREKLKKARNPLASEALRIEEALIATGEHTRQVARGMSPVVAEGSGLMNALRQLTRTTSLSHRIRCTFLCPDPVQIENPTAANELYRIAQEAIYNALHHGRAKRITLRLNMAGGGIRLAVMDDGCGIPSDVSKALGMGLRVMQYRANLIGGQLTVEQRPRGGTKIICRIARPSSKSSS